MFKADNQNSTLAAKTTSQEQQAPGSSLGIHAMPKTSEKSMKIWFVLGGAMLLIIIILFFLII